MDPSLRQPSRQSAPWSLPTTGRADAQNIECDGIVGQLSQLLRRGTSLLEFGVARMVCVDFTMHQIPTEKISMQSGDCRFLCTFVHGDVTANGFHGKNRRTRIFRLQGVNGLLHATGDLHKDAGVTFPPMEVQHYWPRSTRELSVHSWLKFNGA